MEIVAMDMKLRGMYIARQLSFHGVSFRIDEVPLSKEFCKIYDEAVELVIRKIFSNTTNICKIVLFIIVGYSNAAIYRSC